MGRWKGTMTGAAIAIAIMVVYLFQQGSMEDPPPAAQLDGEESPTSVGRADGPPTARDGDDGLERGDGADVEDAERVLAEELRRRIREARRARVDGQTDPPGRRALEPRGERGPASPGAPAAAGDGDERAGSLDPQYIRDAVAEIQPLLAECYELALEQAPTLAGRLIVEFDIEGEPEVGGVVESTAIDEASTLGHPLLDECITETMYTLELPAPEGGGMVHVRYPFDFSRTAAEDEGGAEGAALEETPP